MAKRTQTLQLFPRQGGLNTTLDEGLLPPGTLAQADNIVFDYQAALRRREGINYDWDDVASAGVNPVVGGIDYWVGTVDSKAQYLLTVLADGTVWRTEGGTRTQIPDGGIPWVGTLTEANLEVFNNRAIIAVSGVENRMKYWDGDPANGLRDLPANAYNGTTEIVSVSRASSGNVRTLVLSAALLPQYQVGMDIIITSSNSDYAGSYTLDSIDVLRTTITYTATTALSEATTPDDSIFVGEVAPLALFVREHVGSLWCNDKTNLDRLHYSGVANHMAWLGFGGSGAIDLGIGDGDPAGITGIAPSFKGNLFVGKRTKLYRLSGNEPDLMSVSKVSTGIGFLSHQGITAIDQDDLLFTSFRGIHAMSATNAYGDFTAAYISSDIQRSFVEDWNEGRKRYIKAAYLPELNSAAFSVSERGQARNNAIYLYNVQLKYWYRWPDTPSETLIMAQDTDKRRIYLGTSTGRLARTLTDQAFDTNEAGSPSPIRQVVRTGRLFLTGNTTEIKGFKRMGLIFRAEGSYTLTATVKIDNFTPQMLSFVSNEQAIPLGMMVLGEDVLGGSYVIAPYTLPIDGYGRGCTVTISQNDRNIALTLQGLVLEYETAEDSPETRLSDDN